MCTSSQIHVRGKIRLTGLLLILLKRLMLGGRGIICFDGNGSFVVGCTFCPGFMEFGMLFCPGFMEFEMLKMFLSEPDCSEYMPGLSKSEKLKLGKQNKTLF